jgi:hypothetical protein
MLYGPEYSFNLPRPTSISPPARSDSRSKLSWRSSQACNGILAWTNNTRQMLVYLLRSATFCRYLGELSSSFPHENEYLG